MRTELDGAVWFKSSRSGAGKECVEVATYPAAASVSGTARTRRGPL